MPILNYNEQFAHYRQISKNIFVMDRLYLYGEEAKEVSEETPIQDLEAQLLRLLIE